MWSWPRPLTYFSKTLTLAVTFSSLEIGHSYLACVFLMTRPFRQYPKFWHVTFNVTFDLLLKNFNIAPANLQNALRGPSWLCQYSSLNYLVVGTITCFCTAAIFFFQMIILSMHLYTLDERHAWFYLYRTSQPVRRTLKAEKIQNENFLCKVGLKPNPEIWSLMLYRLSFAGFNESCTI